jgi:hypothetical protein
MVGERSPKLANQQLDELKELAKDNSFIYSLPNMDIPLKWKEVRTKISLDNQLT